MLLLNLNDSDEIANSSNFDKYTQNLTGCDLEPQNPWCGKFGAQQYIEVIYLMILTILGCFGNLLVISSIALEKKVLKNANIFIVNLAVADFLVSENYSKELRYKRHC